MIKAFTGPKPEEILLTNLRWIHPTTDNQQIWVCLDEHPLMGNMIFHYVQNVAWFCSQETWTRYNATHNGHIVKQEHYNLFLALYKVLTKDYYES